MGGFFETYLASKKEKAAAGGFFSFSSDPALVAAAEAFLRGVAGMAAAVGLYHDAVQLTVGAFVVVGAAAYLAANGLTSSFGFVHLLIPPSLMWIVFDKLCRGIPIKILRGWECLPIFAGQGRQSGSLSIHAHN